ncbi:periplasmic mannitol/sorbitol binding protein [Ameyamaea chiangmaiensis NBRC 103196]|uniref:Sugar ABC transporter substrate-binding protein n=1 Tax=Ameyamaea chiangmaiensis TaxID=442969 RepID=A0A850PB94_9PROT|nr:sugar ABC transporter substrate-binding protein [Ameyamaea chiangmaiensis]MBS4075155.1 sugar ABC transporter substrate-binding protein [Ameyamaea chiangmaiensis]NVN40203.1 sugar ABC transporter substrate-binding protein [Ameyamaea chiangmaiensis]GBQ66255.1 periplasmic mannitol/sorbitol binding protein [Ameyamaea chiangmaiensis NBRC 103196]
MSFKRIALLTTAATILTLPLAARAETTLTIATVNNVQMIEMQKLSTTFEKAHPDIHLHWVILEENVLRQRVTTDIATHGGQFDILTIGNYEVPIWAKQKWLYAFDGLPADYDIDDIIAPVRESVSDGGHVYALPFYAESVMTLYRKDLFDKAGITMPEDPTYDQIRTFADKTRDKANGVYGICLRGKPGWGENIAYFSTLVTAFGGQWFDMNWKATIDTPAWHGALQYYVDILRKDGPPGAGSNGFNENLALFTGGHCAIWIDATSAAGTVYDPKQSQVADKVGFAANPTGSFKGGPSWLWSWNLAIPASSTHADAARTFILWATSKEYIQLVAKTDGWVNIPPGTRVSSYKAPEYKAVAPFADFVLQAIEHSNPNGQTAQPRPYVGAQFVDIGPFQAIGTQVGQTVSAALVGSVPLDKALSSANAAADHAIAHAGYGKH